MAIAMRRAGETGMHEWRAGCSSNPREPLGKSGVLSGWILGENGGEVDNPMNITPGLGRRSSEIVAFAEFFGAALLVAVLLHQILRLVLPVGLFAEHGRSLGMLALFCSCALCSRIFDMLAQGQP